MVSLGSELYKQDASSPSGTPAVAVLLAAYNGLDNIAEQVDSIFTQEGVSVSLFISVDLSADGTYEWCKALEERRNDVVVLEYGESFGGAARNFFRLIGDVDFSRFDFVALSDQDDIWLPEKLMHAVSVIRDRSLDAYSSDVIAFWSDGRRRLIKKSYPQKKYDYLFEAAGPGCTYVFTTTSLSVFKQHLVLRRDEMSQAIHHDWVLYAFYRNMGMRWLIDDVPSLLYRQHSSNQVGANIGLQAFAKRFALVKEKWARHQVGLVRSLASVHDDGADCFNRSFLIRNFRQLRRRRRDACALLVLVLFGLF